ncbi:probable tubulin polyglutamylase ttll-15 isoform X2 [Centruroides vittatus]|uniref:probable tubulin polyglutamylase ttll-15 isoform X2 n=1 Tax=Centruroides vittatus TaxID=120091 RepID=UPI00350ECCE0
MQSWLKSRRSYSSLQYDDNFKDKPKYSLPSNNMNRICGRLPIILNIVILTLIIGIIITTINIYELHRMQKEHYSLHHNLPVANVKTETFQCTKPIAWIHGRNLESGYLKHVFIVFERLGYEINNSSSDWDVLWAHDYPFSELSSTMLHLKHYQKVNHFPGSGYVTNKVSLATSNLKHIPAAFQIPDDKEKFLQYKMWVQKSNNHRGIIVNKVGNLDLESEGTFVQEYISNPYLIDGRKFDIGVYTILTSINPLRVYVYSGDVLLRFCSKDYYPFSAANLDSYVVGDDYTPIWKIPSLHKYYVNLGHSMKESLNAHIRSQGKDSEKIWSQIYEAIRTVYYEKENDLIHSGAKYQSLRNFFEMVRFDFLLDENLNAFLMEANMSPNLSSAHFSQNRLLYEQVIYNLLSVVGLTRIINPSYIKSRSENEKDMQVSSADIYVFSDLCASKSCQETCSSYICRLCKRCLSIEEEQIFKDAYLEHVNRKSCLRILPPQTTQNILNVNKEFEHLNERNQLMAYWFKGKCLNDITWCS